MHVRRRIRLAARALAVLLPCVAAGADGSWYVAPLAGGNLDTGLSLRGGDNDRASRCDEFVNPEFAALPGCTDPDRGIGAVDAWKSEFDSGGGALFGAALGRHLGQRVRLEIEYIYADTAYDQASPILDPSGVPFTATFGPELPVAQERIGALRTQSMFLNLHLDHPLGQRVALHAGFGAGFSRTRMDYSVIWVRSLDPATIQTAVGLPNEAQVRANLAGTVSSAVTTLRDDGFGYQCMAGVSRVLTPALTLDMQLRWTRAGSFEDAGHVYDRLRSHASNLRRDGSEPVTYRVSASGLGFWGLSLGLRYALR